MSYYYGATLLVIVPIAVAVITATILYQIRPIRKAVTRWIQG
jgi:hypothetical protein